MNNVLFFSAAARGCSQALCPACTARPLLQKTSRSCLSFFSSNKIQIYESWRVTSSFAGWKLILAQRNHLFSSFFDFSPDHQKIIPPRPFFWLILFISQHMNGHFKVTAMSPDPWPPRFWSLVISVMQGLMQSYMSLRMRASAKYLKSKRAQYWL